MMAETTTAHAPISPSVSIADRVTFSRGSVAAKIGEDVDDTTYVQGILYLTEKPYGIFIEWMPAENPEDSSNDWVVTPPTAVSFSNGTDQVSMAKQHSLKQEDRAQLLKRLQFSVDIKELKSFQCVETRPRNIPKTDTYSPWIRLLAKDGTNFIPLYFREGGLSEFITALQMYATLKRSAKEANLILFTDEKAEALQQSVSMLFHKEAHTDFFSKLVNNPYATAMTGLGKVTNFVTDKVIPAMLDFDALDSGEQQEAVQSLMELQRNQDEADNYGRHNIEEQDFELITKVELPDRPIVARDEPMTEQQWKEYQNPDASLKNVRELKLLIFRGGLSPGLRCDVWKFLLNYYPWESTGLERQEIRKRRVDDYFRMKLQWKSINEEQEERFSEFRDRKALVEKDVARTDRTHRFFEGDNNANVSMLYDILMTYCMYNFDLGYVQGMSDLLSPILVVMENEVDAFWCFAGFMEQVLHNFEMDQKRIREQLMQLRDLMMLVNPRLANYLESHNSDNMYFAFRWILVLFKREFSFANIMRLWEILWTEMPCKNFHLLICVAILDQQMNTIIENKFGFTEILKHVNDLSMHIPLEDTMVLAESIYHQLAATQDKLPPHICDILGFKPYGSRSESPHAAHNLNNGTLNLENDKQMSPGNMSTDSVEVL